MTKKKENNSKFDLGLFLLATGALANITIWIGAFVATEAAGPVGVWVRESLLPVLGGLSGLAMGVTVTIGLVYVLARLNQLKPTLERKVKGTRKAKYKTVPNPRFYTAWGSVILLLIISPALLAPYVFMVIAGKGSLYEVMGDGWARAWSVARIVAADLALGAVAMVYGAQLHAIGERGRTDRTARTAASDSPVLRTPKSHSEPSAVRTAKVSATSAASPTDSAGLRPCEEPGCGIPYRWPNGKGAHYKKHHPDLVVRKAIPVQIPAPSAKEAVTAVTVKGDK